MRLGLIPPQSRRDRGACQHGLAEGDAAKRGGIEAAERMERVAFDHRACDRGVQEAQVEMRVVADQHGARTAILADRTTHLAERALQRVPLVYRGPQRVIRVDAVNRERGLFDIGPFERPDVVTNGLATA